MKNKTRILITGNHPVFVKGFAMLLNGVGQVVGEFSIADLTLQVPDAACQPQIIFIANTPKDNTVTEAIATIQHKYPSVPVVLVMFKDNIKELITAIKSGVHGIVQPSILNDEMVAVVNTVAVDAGYFFDLSGERLVYSDKDDIRNPAKLLRVQNLPASSKAFFQLLCTGMSYEEMAAEMQVALPVILQHKDDLSAVLKIKSRVGMVLYAVRNGL